jgi:hypothetical protein
MQYFVLEFRFKEGKNIIKKQAQMLVNIELVAKSEI